MHQIQSVGIVGYGHFGQHVHELIRRFTRWVDVKVYEPNADVDKKHFFPISAVATCDAVVLAVPISSFEKALKKVLEWARGETVIIDVATVKGYTGGLLQKHARPANRPYIASHPMFGPESYEQRRGDVTGMRIVITEHFGVSDFEMAAFIRFLSKLGFDIVDMEASVHDQHLASTLFLNHLIGQIVNRGGFHNTDIDTVSFRNLMAAVDSVKKDTALFQDVFRYCPKECRAVIERFLCAQKETFCLLPGVEKAA